MGLWKHATLLVMVSACYQKTMPSENPSSAHNTDTALNTDEHCTFGTEPTLVKRTGEMLLQYWQFGERDVFKKSVLPEDVAYEQFRTQIENLGADQIHPVVDMFIPKNDEETEIWRREEHNQKLSYSGNHGQLRPIHCLEALLFSYQNARYSQLSHPTEFIVSILRKHSGSQNELRVYFAAGESMYPDKEFYGFDQVEKAIAEGWEFSVMLHNHTIQKNDDLPALGVPSLSTSDVDLLRSLVAKHGLQSAQVTNGIYTINVPASEFDLYLGRE